MISLREAWEITKRRPLLTLALLALGGLIAQGAWCATHHHKLCSYSDVRGETFTVCSE